MRVLSEGYSKHLWAKMLIFGFSNISAVQLLRNTKIVTEMLIKKEGTTPFTQKIFFVDQMLILVFLPTKLLPCLKTNMKPCYVYQLLCLNV